MDLAKSKVVLKKINSLYQSLELGDEISKIEKDLLLDYVKELYESVLDLPSKKGKKHKKSLDQISKKKEKPETVFQPIPEAKVDLIKKPKKSVLRDELEEVDASFDNIEPHTPTSNGVQGILGSAEPSSTTATSSNTSPSVSVAPEIENLFDSSVLDKSDYRFSQTPISDITKAMGINEKLLMINLLFNKDQQDFNYVASKLNYFHNFEEASKYLKTEVAAKYKWSHVDKKEKAIEFIKLIKRKYLS
ncbi:MAG: hypothetical protein P8M34_08165 [Saprospiraceae bacterium]|nr:hypothetical protein [Saprospiraceae bacterium]|tara:strand:+ start:8023 stop:8763 length:741 start_codon:yes stop_codon:yes gene_type:complete